MHTQAARRPLMGRPGPDIMALLRLSGPVVAAELGWMAMGLVDTLMVGRLGATALGGVSIGGSLFMAVSVFGLGMLLGLDYIVSHAHGGGHHDDARSSLYQGVYLALGLSVVLGALILVAIPHLDVFGIDPLVTLEAGPYLRALTWGFPPLLVFIAVRRYMQAIGLVRPIMFALVSANAINALADWVFIFGNLGAPALGTLGAGWATCVSRAYMLLFVLVALARHERKRKADLFGDRPRVDRTRIRRIVTLGFPAAVQVTLEVGVFATATMLAGRLGAVPLAAHQIALVIASLMFMVPLGISSAGAVLVGQALGRGDPRQAAASGWSALKVGVGFMAISALTFTFLPRLILMGFTDDEAVITTGVTLLRIAALFQLFDGVQVVASGILRGTGDTKVPMLANLVGHWMIGLPLGAFLAFGAGAGLYGLWAGLCVGLISVAVFLLVAWMRRVRGLVGAGAVSA